MARPAVNLLMLSDQLKGSGVMVKRQTLPFHLPPGGGMAVGTLGIKALSMR
jgi:hypothetical protein